MLVGQRSYLRYRRPSHQLLETTEAWKLAISLSWFRAHNLIHLYPPTENLAAHSMCLIATLPGQMWTGALVTRAVKLWAIIILAFFYNHRSLEIQLENRSALRVNYFEHSVVVRITLWRGWPSGDEKAFWSLKDFITGDNRKDFAYPYFVSAAIVFSLYKG